MLRIKPDKGHDQKFLFLKGWKHFNQNTPLPSMEEAPYQEWEGFKGQRKDDGRKHGIVREERGDDVSESTYKNDLKEGLEVSHGRLGYVHVRLFKNNERVAVIKYDPNNWSICDSSGDKDLLLSLYPVGDFKP